MGWSQTVTAVIVLLGLSVAATNANAAAGDAPIREAAREVLAEGDYQRELPLRQAGEDPARGQAESRDYRREPNSDGAYERRQTSGDGQIEIPPFLGELFGLLLWMAIFAGGALLLYFLFVEGRNLVRWRKGDWRRTQTGGTPAARHAEAGPPHPEPLRDIDGLAQEGRYSEAVHALLLRGIAVIRDRGASLPSSATSREILRRTPLAEEVKSALSVLVGKVEVSHFGGRDSSEADYLKCREQYQNLEQAREETA